MRHFFYFLIPTLCWGGSFLAIGIAVQQLPPFLGAAIRVLIALVCLGGYLLIKNRKIPRPAFWFSSTLSGLFSMGLAWMFLFWGEKYVAPALAAIVNSSTPLFVTLLYPLITPQDKLSWLKKLGVVTGLAGVMVIFAPELAGPFSFHLMGMIAVLLMAISYAIGILWTRRLSQHISGSVNLFYQGLGAVIFLLLISAATEIGRTPIIFSREAILALLYLGTFSTAFSWIFFFRLVKERGSVEASAITLCVPLIAILLDVIFLKKFLASHQLIGAALVLASVGLIQYLPKRAIASSSPTPPSP